MVSLYMSSNLMPEQLCKVSLIIAILQMKWRENKGQWKICHNSGCKISHFFILFKCNRAASSTNQLAGNSISVISGLTSSIHISRWYKGWEWGCLLHSKILKVRLWSPLVPTDMLIVWVTWSVPEESFIHNLKEGLCHLNSWGHSS